jgi:hypothetical protein
VPDALARHCLSGSGGHCLAVVFVSHSLSGIWAAVQAGLGITLRTRVGMPGNLRVAGGILPSPGNLGIMLAQGQGRECGRYRCAGEAGATDGSGVVEREIRCFLHVGQLI